MTKATIQTDDIVKNFEFGALAVPVLSGISVNFEQGVSYAITGASGAGKSTFMHLLSGLDEPTSGTIFFNGEDIHFFSQRHKEVFLNQSVGHVFQQPYLIRELSVIENVVLPGLVAGVNARARAFQLLDQVGLADYANAKPSVLSGGQQQRAALARALLNKPAFLLADELTGNLDAVTGRAITDLLLNLQREWGMGIIVSTHDAYLANAMQVQLRLENGKLV